MNIDKFAKEQIICSLEYKLPNEFNTFEEYCDLNCFDINNLDKNKINFYYAWNESPTINRCITDYSELNESLKSYSCEFLLSQLEKQLPGLITNYKIFSSNKIKERVIALELSKNENIILKSAHLTNKLKSSNESQKFKEIIKFCNYYVTLINKDENGVYSIYLEPIYTANVINEIKQQNSGILYHITSQQNFNSIKTTGLRPKVGKTKVENGYRYFPSRIYFVRHNKNKNELLKNLKEIIDTKFKNDEYIICKINVNSLNINFYVDPAYDEENNVYTYAAIPPALIKICTNLTEIIK